MAKAVKIKGRIKDGTASIKSLMPHPMRTGTQRDPEGNLIPAHFIQTVTCRKNGEVILTANWGPSVSKDPYFAFSVTDVVPGDVIEIGWVDNKGETSSGSLTLK